MEVMTNMFWLDLYNDGFVSNEAHMDTSTPQEQKGIRPHNVYCVPPKSYT